MKSGRISTVLVLRDALIARGRRDLAHSNTGWLSGMAGSAAVT